MAKEQPKKRGGPKGPRKPIEDRIAIQEAKLADMKMQARVKQDPAKKKIASQIRQAMKNPETPARNAYVAELRKQI